MERYVLSRPLLPKVSPSDQKDWQYLGACKKIIIKGSNPDLLNQKLYFTRIPWELYAYLKVSEARSRKPYGKDFSSLYINI